MKQIFIWLFCVIFGAHALYENCDYYQDLWPDRQYYISSPGYPNRYKPGSSCRWFAVAPRDMEVFLNCEKASIANSESCRLDRLLVSRTGDESLSDADRYCGSGSFSTVSKGNEMNIAFISSPSSTGGSFACSIGAQPTDKPTPEPNDCFCGWKNQNRIVGGTETGVNEFPMMAGLIDGQRRKLYCGATIISEKHAITAAHCLINRQPNTVALLVGDHDTSTGNDTDSAQLILIDQFRIHPQYNTVTQENDIAIVRVSRPIVFSMKVGPVCLPFSNTWQSFDGRTVEALGWGSTDYGSVAVNKLQKVDLNVISDSQCKATYGAKVSNKQICTYKQDKDACQSDSGGPILWKDPNTGSLKLLGVISYGIQCATENPSVNTRVTSYLSWITETTGEKYCVK